MAHPDRKTRESKTAIRAKNDERIEALLVKHNKENKLKPSRKKTSTEISNLIRTEYLIPSKYIRDPAEWSAKSYNLNRQKIDFAKWLYCKYPVPQFMFNLFLNPRPIPGKYYPPVIYPLNRLIFFDWFIVISQGGSFAKTAKELLTKKEAHLFLNAPSNNTIEENIWWAKCQSTGLSHSVTTAISKRLFNHFDVSNLFWPTLITLLKNCEDTVEIESLSDVMDFLRAKYANNNKFTLKGRTFHSLIKLSNEWHREMQLKKFGSENLSWKGSDIPDWKWVDKKENQIWTVKQLHTSKELYYEGRRMKHCVAGYGHRCLQGYCAIFTMMVDDYINKPEKLLTIEVGPGKRFIQARGRANTWPSGRNKLVLGKWRNANVVI